MAFGSVIKTEGLDKITDGRHSIPGTIGQLFTDQDENIWATTFSGLYQIRYAPFVTRKVPVGITAPQVVMVKLDRKKEEPGSPASEGFVVLFPGQEETELVIPRPIVEVTFVAVEEFQLDLVWQQGSANFFYWNGTESKRVTLPKIPGAMVPTGLEVDHDGHAWLTGYAGAFRCDPGKTPLAFEKISGTRGAAQHSAYQGIQGDSRGHRSTWQPEAKEFSIGKKEKHNGLIFTMTTPGYLSSEAVLWTSIQKVVSGLLRPIPPSILKHEDQSESMTHR